MEPRRFLISDGKKLFVAVNDECWCLTKSNSELIDNFNSNQEEADTKMLLHARHASFEGWRKFIIHTPDTDVFIIALSCVPKIDGSLFIETGIRDKRRIIDLSAIKESLKTQIPDNTGYSIEDLLNAPPGLHSFTGCDSVSSMAGKGKAKALKLMMTSSKFVTFVHLGEVEDLQEEDFESVEKFTCRLYCSSQENINNVRYKIYCSKQGKISLASLPPCRHTLKKHCQRANYQTRIWRRCLEQNYLIANPTDHGWIDDDDGNLSVH